MFREIDMAAPANWEQTNARTNSKTIEAGHLASALPPIVLVLACLDFIGWRFHLPLLTSVFPGYATMKPNTALCLALLAVAVLFGRRVVAAPLRRFGFIAALVALITSSLTLVEYLSGRNLGIDQLLLSVPMERFGDPVGRMSPGTAICLLTASLGLVLLDRARRASMLLLLAGGLMAFSGLVGFLLKAGPLSGVVWFR